VTRWTVLLFFLEGDREVFEPVSFEDEWAANLYLASCAGHVLRGDRLVPLTHARIVREVVA
jgi:hypothetical protein